MACQNGSLKKVWRIKEGKKCRMWLFRFRVRKEDRRVENGTIIGALAEFPTKEDAWREVDRLGVRAFINKDAGPETAMTRVLAGYMNKVHGLEYDLSVRNWRSVTGSRRGRLPRTARNLISRTTSCLNGVTGSRTKSPDAISATGYICCGMMGTLRDLRFRRSRR